MSGKLKSFFNSTVGQGDEIKSFLYTSDGTAITQTGGALDVNIASGSLTVDVDLDFATDSVDATGSVVELGATTLAALENINAVVTATDLDIRDLVFATDKVDVTGSEVSLDSATLAALENITVSATDLDIRDLAFATDSVDVSGSSVSISGTVAVTQSTSPWVVSATDLDIRDLAAASDSVASWVNDGFGNAIASIGGALRTADYADTIAQSTLVIADTATAIAAAATQTKIMVQNLDNKTIYIGASDVTSGTGYPVDKNEFIELPFSGTLYAITASGSTAAGSVRVLKLSA